jgi:hypothetical protein
MISLLGKQLKKQIEYLCIFLFICFYPLGKEIMSTQLEGGEALTVILGILDSWMKHILSRI